MNLEKNRPHMFADGFYNLYSDRANFPVWSIKKSAWKL